MASGKPSRVGKVVTSVHGREEHQQSSDQQRDLGVDVGLDLRRDSDAAQHRPQQRRDRDALQQQQRERNNVHCRLSGEHPNDRGDGGEQPRLPAVGRDV
jgi:hypothetical protein